jgi:uncharacterized protein YceK
MRKLLFVVLALLILLGGCAVLLKRSHASSVNTTPIYNTSGAEQMNEHIVIGTATLSLGTVTVTLSGKAVFSSSSSYQCGVSDMTGINATSVIRNSGSSITFNGLVSDVIGFVCVGN